MPEKYEDLMEIEPIKATFRSRHTQLLSKELMKIVEEKSEYLRNLCTLNTILQGDDPGYPPSLLNDHLSKEELADARETTEVLFFCFHC